MGISAELKVYPERGYALPEGLNVDLHRHYYIHDYFVSIVQYGDDDQHAYQVEKEHAEELFEIFNSAWDIYEARGDRNLQAKIRMNSSKKGRLLGEWVQKDEEKKNAGSFSEWVVEDLKKLRDFFGILLKQLDYSKVYVEYRCRH